MPESGTYGSVRGALSNERPYRDRRRTVTRSRNEISTLTHPNTSTNGAAALRVIAPILRGYCWACNWVAAPDAVRAARDFGLKRR
jgi:hypothetical protein